MAEAFISYPTRPPIGRYAGAPRGVRADDAAAYPIHAMPEGNTGVDRVALDACIEGREGDVVITHHEHRQPDTAPEMLAKPIERV